MAGRGRLIFGLRLLGLVLLCLGTWQVVGAIAGSGRGGAGRWFFDDTEVDASLDKAIVYVAVHVAVCADSAVAARFDTSSAPKLRRWCDAVERLSEDKTADSAIRLHKTQNMVFKLISDKLFAAGGDLALLGLELQEANCEMTLHLERISNQAAGAAFSQFLIGLFAFVVGGVIAARSWRRRGSG